MRRRKRLGGCEWLRRRGLARRRVTEQRVEIEIVEISRRDLRRGESLPLRINVIRLRRPLPLVGWRDALEQIVVRINLVRRHVVVGLIELIVGAPHLRRRCRDRVHEGRRGRRAEHVVERVRS